MYRSGPKVYDPWRLYDRESINRRNVIDLANINHPGRTFQNLALAAYEKWHEADAQGCGNHAILPVGYSTELQFYQDLHSPPWRNKYYVNDNVLS